MVHINTNFEFLIQFDLFLDMDLFNTLTYTVEESGKATLPEWLTFSQQLLKISGSPKTKHLLCANQERRELPIYDPGQRGFHATYTQVYCNVSINITVNDLVSSCSQQFVIQVYNNIPFQINHVAENTTTGQEIELIYHVNTLFNYKFPKRVFHDNDTMDPLKYQLFLHDQDRLPSWIKFNSQYKSIYGTALQEDLFSKCPSTVFDATYRQVLSANNTLVWVRQQRCLYIFKVMVKDPIHSANMTFNLTIFNNYPYVNYPIYFNTLNPPGYSDTYLVQINQRIEYYFPITAFSDLDRGD